MLDRIMLFIISLLHIMVILFVISGPLFNSNYLLFLHAYFICFLMMHWLMNNNMCVLTMAENKIRQNLYGYDDNTGYIARIINPIFNFKNDNEWISTIIYVSCILLFLTSIYKLYNRYKNGYIKKITDMLII